MPKDSTPVILLIDNIERSYHEDFKSNALEIYQALQNSEEFIGYQILNDIITAEESISYEKYKSSTNLKLIAIHKNAFFHDQPDNNSYSEEDQIYREKLIPFVANVLDSSNCKIIVYTRTKKLGFNKKILQEHILTKYGNDFDKSKFDNMFVFNLDAPQNFSNPKNYNGLIGLMIDEL